MSLTFSRRSFLKYTAVAAVAVAGSSLLTGCKDNPYQPEGGIGDSLKIMGTFQLSKASYDVDARKLTCDMSFKCTSDRDLNIKRECFQVIVADKDGKNEVIYSLEQSQHNKISLSNAKSGLSKKDDALETKLYVEDLVALKEGDTVKVQYWPRAQASQGQLGYTDAYATWTMTYKDGKLI